MKRFRILEADMEQIQADPDLQQHLAKTLLFNSLKEMANVNVYKCNLYNFACALEKELKRRSD